DRAGELGLDRPGLHVVYPAVSTDFGPVDPATRDVWRTELGISEPHVVLNVKRLHPLAGQRHLVDAFARIAATRRDVRLVICGTGPLRGDLEAQAQRAGVADLVTFAGLVPNDTVARFAAVADVFALPSELEALPTVAVEALAAGTPVVSTDHPGGVELHGVFGEDVQVVARGVVWAGARPGWGRGRSAMAPASARAAPAPRNVTRPTSPLPGPAAPAVCRGPLDAFLFRMDTAVNRNCDEAHHDDIDVEG